MRLTLSLRARAVTVSFACLASVLATGAVAAAEPAQGTIAGEDAPGAVQDRYIVVFKNTAPEATQVSSSARNLAARFGGNVRGEFTRAVRGFTVEMPEAAAKRLAADPAVASVEQDRVVRLTETQTGPTWGLDRLDQRTLPLSGTYTYPNTASTVTAYILDTGVRLSHTQFGGRARSGYDFVNKDADASDCQGHGTHVAGTVAGATYGVAKQAKIVSVRVLDCAGSGTFSGIIAGVDWVTKNAVKPAVANMSLGGPAGLSLDTAVRNSIAAGITYVVAAGNSNTDACTASPARVGEAITVGATDAADKRASFSNRGTCVDLFAPGVNVQSATKDGDTTSGWMSGTSMAAPHVAGAAAMYLSANPAATPAKVRDLMVAQATAGVVTDAGTGSPNLLLHTGALSAAPTPPPACTVSSDQDQAIADRSSKDTRLTVSGCTGLASTTSSVEVHVKHADRGDLTVSLVAPDGSVYDLRSATPGDDVANLDAVYRVNLGSESRNGTWTLRVSDRYLGDTGYLDRWALTL
ncbi:S8 family peptidase [Actinophytocola sp.]|uniref:S8 family peptidase n=1 Tax=Actinophytocola sp. TaxID=1872138 RepID=UPI002ED0167F